MSKIVDKGTVPYIKTLLNRLLCDIKLLGKTMLKEKYVLS